MYPQLSLLMLSIMVLANGMRLSMTSVPRKIRYSIRLARKEDISAINICNRRNLPENYSLMFYDDHLKRWPDLSLVAETEDNQMMGYALGRLELAPLNKAVKFTAFYKPDYVGHVASLAVNDEFRGLGVARNMMEQLHASFALYHKVDAVSLYCRVTNEAAVQLYSKVLKYECDRVVRGYYQDNEDAWYMKLTGLLEKYSNESEDELVQHLLGGSTENSSDCIRSTARFLMANSPAESGEDQRRRELVRLITAGSKSVMRQ